MRRERIWLRRFDAAAACRPRDVRETAFFAMGAIECTHLDDAGDTLYFRGFTPVFIGPCRAIRRIDREHGRDRHA
jgi:hypothetical protein